MAWDSDTHTHTHTLHDVCHDVSCGGVGAVQYVGGMLPQPGCAAVADATPELAPTVPELLAHARAAALDAARALVAACEDPAATPPQLDAAADNALQAAGLLRGFARMSVR